MRVRITAAWSLLLAVALTGAGLIVYAIESPRIDDRVTADIDRTLRLFQESTRAGRDPATGLEFDSVARLLQVVVPRIDAADHQDRMGWVAGRPVPASPPEESRLLADPSFTDAVTDLVDAGGGDTTLDSASGEEVRLTAQVVEVGESSRGAFLVVSYPERAREGLARAARTYAVAATFTWVTLSLLAGGLSMMLLAPLRRLRSGTERIAGSDLSHRLPAHGGDEGAELARAVNNLAARLEAALTDQRALLDDAASALRAPLGDLQDALDGLDGLGEPAQPAPGKAVAAGSAVAEAAARMSRLLDDLEVLAECRRPDFLKREPVQLQPFTETLLAEARRLADRDWRFDGADEVTVLLDRRRIGRAVLALATNAAQHTEPGDVVAIGSSYDGRRADIWVRDTGPGVPPADRGRIFDRFTGADPAQGRYGLGLTMASAVAAAHGGRVDIEDAEPQGAVFVISLPVTDAAPGHTEHAR